MIPLISRRYAAIGLVLVFITVVLILIGFRLMGRDFMLRRTAA